MRLTARFIFFATLIGCLAFAQICMAQGQATIRRAAFDIGSAAIKCTIADVDTQTGRIVSILETQSHKIDYAEDLGHSYDSNLSKEIMAEGIDILKKMKEMAKDLNVLEYSAAGGSVFRTARNGRAYFVQIEEKTGIPSRIVSEQQAAMLSYHAVQQTMIHSNKSIMVWDIGGGSMTMTMRDLEGGLLFYLNPMASVPFKNLVIELFQGKNPDTVSTPNPLQEEEVAKALTYIKSHAAVSVPARISSKLKHMDIHVAGIGGVHYYAMPEMLGGREEYYTRDQVAEALTKWTGKSDEDIDSEYANTRVTNLILVLGYMDALGLKSIHPLKIDQSNGLLAAPEFW